MLKTLKYRIYPTACQERLLFNTLEECRWLYNHLLEQRKNTWEQEQKSLNYHAQAVAIPGLKHERQSLASVHSQVLQNVAVRVDLAFKAFFRRVKAGEKPGYPRFRGKERYDSFTYPQFGFSLENGMIKIAKIGLIKAVIHRPLEGKIKTLTLRRYSTGKWYACFSCEVKVSPLPPSTKVVGIDVGLESFATLSTGDKIAIPRFFRTDEKALAKVQRKLSKLEKGTSERSKVKKVVCRIHERIVNRRHNFIHQEARKLVNSFGVIAVEKLNINRMLGNHCLAKSIADASWGQFINTLSAKAEEAGREFVMVNPNGTSQLCSRCHSLVPKDLSVRIHSCPFCGLILDRDLNASYNILSLGLQAVGKIPRSRLL